MNDQSTLAAGGIVPFDSKPSTGDAVDTVVARAYAHPALPGRRIVRLCAESVAAGDDLEMATLGFASGEERGKVGKERKRPLGFPGWALVHDPKNARYALDVVKELKKHARKAKSKPGHAKEAFDAIATKLSKTVPHFLPSFYEEVGRVFIEHGAPGYAASMFGKAREVEAVHALEIDEQHRIDGFLEFALAGAVTTKALSEYAKQLAEHHEPKVAYAHFRQLCVQRTLGGMPPWSGMSKDLGRLAKAAKLDVDAESAALIAEIIESPALVKAAGEFWRAYAAPIAVLGKQSPSVRGVLLNLFPTGTTYSAELDEVWLDLVDATGAVDALLGDDGVAPEARPTGGRAAWFDKLCAHVARSWRSSVLPPRVYALLRRMAPALIADGKPIKGAGRYRIDLDLAELALELGVAVDPPEAWHADGDHWVQTKAMPEHGRDPVRCAAHPKLGIVLQAAVYKSIGNDAFDNATRGMQGFLAAKRQWLESTIARAESAALPALDATLTLLEQKASAATFAELPELHARLAAIEVAPALARTLQAGIIDELGWPALEELIAELSPDGKTEITMHGAPPAVVAATKTRAIALVGDERKPPHDFVIPPKHELATVRYIGDQYLVVVKEGYYKIRAYWSSTPRDLWEVEGMNAWLIQTSVSTAVVLADGAWLEGGRPIRPGDRTLPFTQRVAASDGTTAWIHERKDGEQRLRELTPTGELGRYSFPAWIGAFAEDDWKIDLASHCMPAPAGVTSSPLGVANGMVGTRVRYRGASPHWPTHRELESIDGVRVACAGEIRPHDLLAFPDGGLRRPLGQEHVSGKGSALLIYDPSCAYVGSRLWAGDLRYGRGQASPMSSAFLHLYTARDAGGSTRIHAATSDDARALIAAVPATALEVVPVDLPGVLPEVTHPRLRRGLAGLAAMAAQQNARRDELVKQRAPGNAAAATSMGPADQRMLDMLGGWGRKQWAQPGSAWAQIERVAAAFASDDHSDRTIKGIGTSVFDWLELATVPSSLVFLALAIGTPADQRALAIDLYEHLVRKLPPADKLRVLFVQGELAGEESHGSTEFQVRWHGGRAYAIRQWGYRGNHYHVLEYAPSGRFELLPGLMIDRELRGNAGTVDVVQLREAVSAGKTSWNPEVAERLAAATGLTPSEATYLWAGCPNAGDRGASFLDKELRETLGLKAVQAALARDALAVAKFEHKIATIDEAGRAGIAALLEGSAADVLAAAWAKRYGRRIAIPEELIAEADAMSLSNNVPGMLALVLGGEDTPQLTTDGVYAFSQHATLIPVSKLEPLVGQAKVDAPHFDVATISTLVVYLPYLYDALAVGDPLRGRAVVAYRLALKRLANPDLWIAGAAAWLDKDKAEAFDRLVTSVGGDLVPGILEDRTLRRIHGGAIVRHGTSASLFLRLGELDAKGHAVFDPLAKQIDGTRNSAGRDIEYLRGPDLRAMMERIDATPVPAGGWEQNPLLSVPGLVDKIAKALELSREAAALYLQYLVLLWPVPKALAAYNGWKPKQLAAAQAALVDKELVLEAKRERAQRGHFLPGGWEALKSPHPPLETWKLPFYGTRVEHGVSPHFYRLMPMQPYHLLFERAWARIEDGDKPRYEEVKR